MVHHTVEALKCPYTIGYVHWRESNEGRCGKRPSTHTLRLWVLANSIQSYGLCFPTNDFQELEYNNPHTC